MDEKLFTIVYDYLQRGTNGTPQHITVERIKAFKSESDENLSHNINALIDNLLDTRSDRDVVKINKISLIKQLFDENIINEENIDDNTLMSFLSHKDLLINFLFPKNYVSIERFLSFRSTYNKSNILDYVIDVHYDNPEDKYHYFKFFCEKGAKLLDCNLEYLSMTLIKDCRLDIIKYILNYLDHINLPKDIFM